MISAFHWIRLVAVLLLGDLVGPPVALAQLPACVGDCNGDTAITVDEILLGVNIALGVAPMSTCTPFDVDFSGTLTVDELVSSVDGALRGCLSGPTPTPTPDPVGPEIVALGLADSALAPVAPSGVDAQGRSIYSRLFGNGHWLIVEAAPGVSGRRVGERVFDQAPADPLDRPDIQVIVSRPLGDGSPVVCDNSGSESGGVPAVEPFDFSQTQLATDVMAEMSCRIDGGARTRSGDACTTGDEGFGFAFINPIATAQFCIEPARAWAFPVGDTLVAARVLDVAGNPGPVREMVVRIAQ